MDKSGNSPESFFDVFRAVSYDQFKVKIESVRRQRGDLRLAKKQREQAVHDAQAKASSIRSPGKREWLSRAASVYDVNFIVMAKPDFWHWLEKVHACSHLHLDLKPESHAVEPFYNCRWCGATVACACRYPDGRPLTGASHHWARREATNNELFRPIFVRPGICYRCRGDESLAAAYQHGKDRIERLLWRELLQEEIELQCGMQQPDYESLDQIIRASSWNGGQWKFASTILTQDESGVILQVLERALRIKRILRKAGRQETIKSTLIDFVKAYSHLCNSFSPHDIGDNLYALEDDLVDDGGFLRDYADMPYTLHLPTSHGNPVMWRSYDLERHPEKVTALPYPFQLALLAQFVEEGPLPILSDTRRMAKERLVPLLDGYSAECDLDWAMKGVQHADTGLFLKMITQAWEKDRTVVEKRRDEIRQNLVEHRMLWAVWEYDRYASGNYSGFENSVKKNADLGKWLLSASGPPDVNTLLKRGEVVTNVVGMKYIPWDAYLDLDRYIGKGGFHLLRETDNQADPKAITVYLEGFGRTGYIKRSLAALLAPAMDHGMEIEAELFARHYPYYDHDMTLYLRLKQAAAPLKPPDRSKKYRKRPQKKPELVVVRKETEQEKALSKAKHSLDEAQHWLEEDIGHERIPDSLHTAVMYAMESWFFGQGIKPDMGNGWHSMKAQFIKQAPHQLRFRVESALRKSASLQGHVGGVLVRYALQGNPKAGSRRWRWEVAVVIKQIGTLIRLTEETIS
ncbi:MAG: HIRAN domain-containing protein [Syntrophobacterales bacterium]|nr:HIRAN domain-containing protein [Syntrophobacterales bacterium]